MQMEEEGSKGLLIELGPAERTLVMRGVGAGMREGRRKVGELRVSQVDKMMMVMVGNRIMDEGDPFVFKAVTGTPALHDIVQEVFSVVA